MVFRLDGRLRANEKFFYNGMKLEIINGFQHVGLLFTPKLSIYRMTDELAKKAKRIIVSVLHSLNSYGSLTSSAFFKIFDMKICPLLLYDCEVWGIKQ